jgi:hypothetical protein
MKSLVILALTLTASTGFSTSWAPFNGSNKIVIDENTGAIFAPGKGFGEVTLADDVGDTVVAENKSKNIVCSVNAALANDTKQFTQEQINTMVAPKAYELYGKKLNTTVKNYDLNIEGNIFTVGHHEMTETISNGKKVFKSLLLIVVPGTNFISACATYNLKMTKDQKKQMLQQLVDQFSFQQQ